MIGPAMLFDLFLILVSLVLIAISGLAILNTLTFPRLTPAGPAQETNNRPVSVLIPARNEAAIIGRTIKAILAQDNPNLELIVLDDSSEDETATLAQEAGANDPRFRLIRGQELPAGWLGKNWACHQLAEAAGGDWLIFTDADVAWRPGALAAVLALAETERADLLTIWPTQQSESWGERLTIPLMALTVIGYLPLVGVHHLPWSILAAANGQCMIFRQAAYERIGGHKAARRQIVEDVALARLMKRHGGRLWMADGAGLIGCRMYQDWPAVRDGFAKNILAGHNNSILFLLLSTLFHWLLFLLPWLWLAVGWALPLPGWPAWPLAWIALGVGVRALSAAATGQRARDALALPVSVLLMTVIAGQSLRQRWRGGPKWKGRALET